MRLEKASQKAIKFACLNFHYAKRFPLYSLSFSVFNNQNEWCGVILYGFGATINISKPYNLPQGSVIELQRVALNGKQESTSKSVAISLNLLKKKCPMIRLVISYADSNQNHTGIIYQAGNWYFEGEKKSMPIYFNKEGKQIHSRNVNNSGSQLVFGKRSKTYKKDEVKKVTQLLKYKYIYPLHKSLIPLCKSLSKPYPKKQTSAGSVKVAQQASSLQEGFDSTPALT